MSSTSFSSFNLNNVKMAAYMTISSRYPSWKEYYLSKGKGTKGFLEETMKFDDSLASDAPFTFVNDPLLYFLEVDRSLWGRVFPPFAPWWKPSQLGPELFQGSHGYHRRSSCLRNPRKQEVFTFQMHQWRSLSEASDNSYSNQVSRKERDTCSFDERICQAQER